MLSSLLFYCWLPVSCACNPVCALTEVYRVYEGVSRVVGRLVASSRITVKYGVWFGRVLVVYLYTIACYFIDVELLYSVHLSAFIGWMEDFRNIVYWPNGMPLLQEVLCESRLSSGIFKISKNVQKALFQMIYLFVLHTSFCNLDT